MEYRKFRFKNANGEYYELADPKYYHFLYQPSGLGFRGTLEGYRFKNRYNKKDIQFELPSLSGTMIFHADTIQENYELYRQFILFLEQTPLEIEYLTDQYESWNKAKYAECEIIQVDKSETDEYGLLRTPIRINCFTFWRDREIKQYIAKPGIEGEQLQIPMTFPFYFGKDRLRGIVVENNGTMEAPLTVQFNGTSVNPSFRIFDENGNEYGACKFDGTFSSVRVESDTEKITLTKDGRVLTNPARYEDLTIGDLNNDDYYLTFINLKPGKSLMTVTPGSSFTGEIIFTWRDEYKSF